MNELDDSIAERIATIFRQDATWHVFAEPPESVDDVPAFIVAEINGDMSGAAFAGMKEATVTARCLALIALRGRDGLSASFAKTRLYASKVLGLLWTHDELASDGESSIAEIKSIRWREGKIAWGGQDYSGIEFNIDMRVDWQMYYGSGPVGTLP